MHLLLQKPRHAGGVFYFSAGVSEVRKRKNTAFRTSEKGVLPLRLRRSLCVFIGKIPFWTKIVWTKVKIGQRKAGLSQYLREMQETGEPVEVCVRERPVAYLTPIPRERDTGSSLPPETMERLRAAGIRVIPAKKPKGDWVPIPGKADDSLVIANTVVAMREEKDW